MKTNKCSAYLLAFCLFACVLFVVFLYFKYIGKPNVYPPINRAASSFRELAGHIEQFYKDNRGSVLIDPTAEFLEYVSGKGFYFIGDDQRRDLDSAALSYGIYLLLPTVLTSEAPMLLAYSTPFTVENGEVERIALFYRNQESIPLKLPSGYLKWIIGEDIEVETRPDLYYDPLGYVNKLESER